jgi:hypothetical protein
MNVMEPLVVLANAAAPLPNPDDGPAILNQLLDAIGSGNWRLVASLIVVGLVWLMRRFATRVHPWFGTDRGGVAVALLGGLLAVAAGELAAGRGFTVQTVANGISLAIAAAGGWVMVRRLVSPPDAANVANAPAAATPGK